MHVNKPESRIVPRRVMEPDKPEPRVIEEFPLTGLICPTVSEKSAVSIIAKPSWAYVGPVFRQNNTAKITIAGIKELRLIFQSFR